MERSDDCLYLITKAKFTKEESEAIKLFEKYFNEGWTQIKEIKKLILILKNESSSSSSDDISEIISKLQLKQKELNLLNENVEILQKKINELNEDTFVRIKHYEKRVEEIIEKNFAIFVNRDRILEENKKVNADVFMDLFAIKLAEAVGNLILKDLKEFENNIQTGCALVVTSYIFLGPHFISTMPKTTLKLVGLTFIGIGCVVGYFYCKQQNELKKYIGHQVDAYISGLGNLEHKEILYENGKKVLEEHQKLKKCCKNENTKPGFFGEIIKTIIELKIHISKWQRFLDAVLNIFEVYLCNGSIPQCYVEKHRNKIEVKLRELLCGDEFSNLCNLSLTKLKIEINEKEDNLPSPNANKLISDFYKEHKERIVKNIVADLERVHSKFSKN